MSRIALPEDLLAQAARAGTRPELTRILEMVALNAGATRHVILEDRAGQHLGQQGIVASNWTIDEVLSITCPTIDRFARAVHAVGGGNLPVRLADLGPSAATIGAGEMSVLAAFGHDQALCLRVQAGRASFYALLTAPGIDAIDRGFAPQARLLISYLVSDLLRDREPSGPLDPLSERERECLFWVAEGKTTEDVALILGVSANTINTYISHAIQKLGAGNRAMAIAIAIRQDLL